LQMLSATNIGVLGDVNMDIFVHLHLQLPLRYIAPLRTKTSHLNIQPFVNPDPQTKNHLPK
jgi:hypothetical protein